MGKKLVIMVCIAAMIMTNLPNWDAGADVSGTAPSEAGDTVVGNATVWKDMEIILNGNLTVNETGSLTLDNVTLLMNCITNGSYYIEVQPGGEMYILNNSNISSANEYRYLFWVKNDSKFEMRNSELHGCGYEWDNRGLLIETDNVTIESSTISHNYVGISLRGSSNNIITNSSILYSTYYGINVAYSSNNNVVTNCNISSNNWVGIILFQSSSNNTITGCNISKNGGGIYIGYSSNNNTITDCNIEFSEWNGIHIYETSSNNIVSNCILYSNTKGISISYSSNNSITNCTVYNNSDDGIYLHYSSNNQITNCAVYNNSWGGIRLYYSSNNQITNCAVYNNYWCGILLDFSSNNQITNNAVYNNSHYGIYLGSSSDNQIINCIISSNNETGIYLVSSSDTLVANSTISGNYSNPDYHDISLSSDSHLNLLNTIFTNVSFADNASTLNVSWYLNVNVKWKNSIPAEYADVRIQDNENGTFDENHTTDKNGLIKDIVVQEYTQNQTENKTFFTPHNVTASQGHISIWDDNVTVNETKTIELMLDHNAPVINYTTISPEQEYTIDENDTIEFKFNISHPDDLNLTYYWYLDGVEVKNGTLLENTSKEQKINWTGWSSDNSIYYFNFTSHINSPYTVKVTVSDGNATVSYIWVLTVNDVNGRPEITYFYPPKGIVLGNLSCVIFNVTASDPDNDEISYQWTSNGAPVSNENEYVFYAEYNASGNNTYIIEIKITDGKLPDNRTWTVTVVDWNASYDYLLLQIELLKAAIENITKLIGNITETLLNQTELLENITWLVENIKALNMTVLKEKLAQLFIELENMNITLAQLNENLTRIQEELNNAMDKIGNLTAMLENANATRDQANETRDLALLAKEDAENKAKEMENKMNEAIKAKNKAEYKLAASVVISVIAGIIAGFLISFLLRRKLPKKG